MEGKVIVVGADFAGTGDDAIRAGLQQLASGAAQTLHVVYVFDASAALLPAEEREPPSTPTTSMVIESLSRRVHALAELERVRYREGQVRIEVRTGDVLTGLLAAIRHHRADLAIVGTHGRQGIDRWLAGSIAERLVRTAECSVLVARPPREPARHLEADPPEHSEPVEPAWRPTVPPPSILHR